jgi:beta-glucuronidase
VPTGGWWNYGGLLREVYLKRVDTADFNFVQVLPELPCRTCAATVRFRVNAGNFAASNRRLSLTGRFGTQSVRFDPVRVAGSRTGTFESSIRVASPRLWSPRNPRLYDVRLDLSADGKRVSTWRLKSGIRSVKVVNGRLQLNGLPVNLRGVGFHEDTKERGLALTNEDREVLFRDSQDVGATLMRTHYPPHPQLHEMADREGMLIWSEIPMYAIKTEFLKSPIVRRTGLEQLQENILVNGNHPSVMTWSVGNELSSRPGPVQGDYIKRAADLAHELDPTRPVSYAFAGYPAAGCQPRYAPLDLLGVNDYFGWYPGPNGQIADRTVLSEYLDSLRTCYPTTALVVSEFGAEANRSGPIEEKGTFEFQSDFINYHLNVMATKPWLSGAFYWALKEFRVRPAWEGGNPRPSPPLHQKGVIAYDGTRKQGFFDLQRQFQGVDQFPGEPARRARASGSD